jgi:hypothetical protein
MTTSKKTATHATTAAASPAEVQAHQAPVPGASDLADMPIAALQTAVTQAMSQVQQIRASLPNPTRLTADERKHTNGKLRNGEAAVLAVVCGVAQDPKYAPLVASLAERDYGTDPAAFEAALLEERLQRVAVLAPLVQALTSLTEDLGDTVLDLQELSANPAREAYAIFKSVAKTDATLSSRIKDTIDFYAAIARAAAETRKAKKEAASATPATTAPGGKA